MSKNKYIVFADLHLGAGEYAWEGRLEHGENVIYIGDCWEFKNISKSYVPEQTDNLIKHLELSKTLGTVNVSGNHEIRLGKALIKVFDLIIGDTLFTHGHRAVYSEKKIKKWENRKAGMGFFMLMVMRIKRSKFYPSKWSEPSKSTKDKLAKYARSKGCSRIVVGHFHKDWMGDHNGVRICLCGRGRTEVEI